MLVSATTIALTLLGATPQPQATAAPAEHQAQRRVRGHLGPRMWMCVAGACDEEETPLGWGWVADAGYRLFPRFVVGGKFSHTIIPRHNDPENRTYRRYHFLTIAPSLALHAFVDKRFDPYVDFALGFLVDRRRILSSEDDEASADFLDTRLGLSVTFGVGADILIRDGWGLGPYVGVQLPLILGVCGGREGSQTQCQGVRGSEAGHTWPTGLVFSIRGRFSAGPAGARNSTS